MCSKRCHVLGSTLYVCFIFSSVIYRTSVSNILSEYRCYMFESIGSVSTDFLKRSPMFTSKIPYYTQLTRYSRQLWNMTWKEGEGKRWKVAGREKKKNELIKTSVFSASSISTECEGSTIHFSILSFDIRSFSPLALRCKKILRAFEDCTIFEFVRHCNAP